MMPEGPLDRMAELARETGARVYVVGGYVRDRLLGREPLDLDLLVEGDATPFLQGLSRAGGSEPVIFSRKRQITYRLTLENLLVDLSACEKGALGEALGRRDFTINTLAVALEQAASRNLDSPIDLFGGMKDLKARCVRHLSVEALEEDPIRLLRAVRLAVVLDGFRLATETLEAMRGRAGLLRGAPAERAGMELDAIFASSRAGAGARLMREADMLFTLLPELAPLDGLVQNRWHDHDVLEHTLRCVEEADRLQAGHAPAGVVSPVEPSDVSILKWSALLHDLGKAATAAKDAGGEVRFIGHEIISADLAATALRRLRVGARNAERIRRLIANHLRLSLLSAAEGITDRALRRLVHDVKQDTPLLALLAVADRRAAGGPRPAERLARLEQAAARAMETLDREGEQVLNPPRLLKGTEVMQILGLPPGPRVGEVLEWLTQRQVDGKLGSREEATRLLKSLTPRDLEDLDREG